ncbi:MAG TPA: lysophospholipid acyltransferase family protein [Caulobacteraceae bacterium]|nr:lysophospholipid acyltransferase family protein [Caulobacteraceae bacterium]
MTAFRSWLFALLFYAFSGVVALAILPLLLAPRRWLMAVIAAWSRGLVVLLRLVCAIRVEFRGLEHLPRGGALIAAKHQCMFDTMAPLGVFADACYVLRRELLRIPVYGWYARKTRMIAVDRAGGASALKRMVAEAAQRLGEGRQVVIFPEGTRTPEPGAPYKPGVAGLYRDLGVPCIPLATNSGAHWPAHGFTRRPGLIVYEFLPPIAPGMPRAAFMRELRDRLEGASAALAAL